MDTSLFSIQKRASLSLYCWFWSWRLTLLPFHYHMDRSLDTACYAHQAGGLLLPSLHHWFIFILSKLFPTISVDPYDIVIFEEKRHICKVIAAMLISTKPPLIPGINHYCLWSLAPASTMVRLRLQRVAT